MPEYTTRAPLPSRLSTGLTTLALVIGGALIAVVPATPAAAVGPVIDCSSDPSILNTGYDRSGGRLTSGDDLGWEFSTSLPNYAPAPIVTAPPAQWATSPFNNASWISHRADTLHAGRLYTLYRYQFELAPSVDPDGFSVSLDFFADNSVRDLYINGISQAGVVPGIPQAPANPHTYLGYVPGSQAQVTLNDGWQTGQNEIVVFVDSSQYSSGFLAQTTSRGFCSDFGDAPASYGTAKVDSGASHVLTDYDGTTASLMLGTAIDEEPDAAGLTGTEDDATGRDDEDAATFPPLSILTSDYSTSVAVTNTSGATATLAGWVDFDGSGTFDTGELATASVASGETQATLSWSGVQPVEGATFARLRLFPGSVATPSPTGSAMGGEVEDYPLTVLPGGLEVTKVADTTVADEGDTVGYTITVTNTSAAPAYDVVVTDDLSDVLDDAVYVSGSATSGTLTSTAGVLRWEGDLAPGATATISYSVIVTASVTGNRVLTNAVVESTLPSGNTSPCRRGSTSPLCISVVTASPNYDFGDAPSSYLTTLAGGGARHELQQYDAATHIAALMIGATVDPEADASADDNSTGVADEDGASLAAVPSGASTYSTTVAVVNSTGADATLAGWIDFNRNGTFETAERATVTVPAGATSAQLTWTGISPTAGTSSARLRIMPGVVAAPNPAGLIVGGEVEDHRITMTSGAGLAFTGSAAPSAMLLVAGGTLLLGGGIALVIGLRRRRVRG